MKREIKKFNIRCSHLGSADAKINLFQEWEELPAEGEQVLVTFHYDGVRCRTEEAVCTIFNSGAHRAKGLETETAGWFPFS